MKEEPSRNFRTEKNIITKVKKKKKLYGLNSKMEMTEDRFNELENRSIEIIQSEKHRGTFFF